MKFKIPQLLGGIAALAFIFTNFLYLINWFVEGYEADGEIKVFIWLLTALIQIAALIVFTLLFKNKVIRYIAVGVLAVAGIFYYCFADCLLLEILAPTIFLPHHY